MTEDRLHGDASPDDDYLNDDEFVLDLGEGEFAFGDGAEPTSISADLPGAPEAEGEPADAASRDERFGLRPIGLPEDLDEQPAAEFTLVEPSLDAEATVDDHAPFEDLDAELAVDPVAFEAELELASAEPAIEPFDSDVPVEADWDDSQVIKPSDPVVVEDSIEGAVQDAPEEGLEFEDDTSADIASPALHLGRQTDDDGADDDDGEIDTAASLFGDAADLEPTATFDFNEPVAVDDPDRALLDDELLDMGDDAPFDLVDAGADASDAEPDVRGSDEVLFTDSRSDIAPTSAFGADLGPPFGDRDDFEMPDLDFVEPEQVLATTDATDPFSMEDGEDGVDSFEVELSEDELGDDSFLAAEEAEGWREEPMEAAAETQTVAHQLRSVDSGDPDGGDDWSAGMDDAATAAASEMEFAPLEEQHTAEVADDAAWTLESDDASGFDGGAFESADDAWSAAPELEDDVDPIYGDEVSDFDADASMHDGVVQEQFAGAAAAPSFHSSSRPEHEAAYATASVDPQVTGMAVAVRPRRSALQWAATIAALLPIAIVGAVVFAKPDLVMRLIDKQRGQPQPILVDRIAIARPRVELPAEQPSKVALAQPKRNDAAAAGGGGASVANTPNTGTTQRQPADETTPAVGVTPSSGTTEPPSDGDSTPDAVQVAEPTGPTPPPDAGQGPDVVVPGADGRAVTVATPGPARAASGDVEVQTSPVSENDGAGDGADTAFEGEQVQYLPAGDLLIAKDPGGAAAAELPQFVAGLRPGSMAFVMLHNGAFFTGAVTRLEPESLSIAQDSGVLTFDYATLREASPLASADLSEVTATQNGFVRLRNRARLFGSMLRNPDRSVTLHDEGATITVPEWQIQSVGAESTGGVALVRDEDGDAWLRERARRRLEEQKATSSRPPR